MSKKQTCVITNIDFESEINTRNLIVKPILIEGKEQLNKYKCNLPENNVTVFNKRIKQKIVNKVKSWSNKEKNIKVSNEIDSNLSKSLKHLNINSNSSEELHRSLLQKENGILDNHTKDERGTHMCNSQSCSPQSDERKENWTEHQNLSSVFYGHKPSTSSTPGPSWNLCSEKNHEIKNDNKNITSDAWQINKEDGMSLEGKLCLNFKSKENSSSENIDNRDIIEGEYPYKYNFFKKSRKSVVFTNEVCVVYFNGDEVIYESKEPLKKGVEQQTRNKEMRHGHLLNTQEKYNLCLF